jgi:hypothetical protein
MSVAGAARASGRDLRLDFFRGLSLWFIFLDHIASNAVSWITVGNYGFSDAAEIFVFISGYTVAYVYGRALQANGIVIGGARLWRRAWQLYVAFVFLVVIYIAQVAYVSEHFKNPLYPEELGVLQFMKEPEVALMQTAFLRFMPQNIDVLPLYIVLIFFFPPVLWAMLRRPNLVLALSVLLYALARHFGWTFTLYPSHQTWFFNPFAWQLLFVIGAWCAAGGAKAIKPLFESKIVLVLCIFYLAAALLLKLTSYVPWLIPHMPPSLMILPLDKTNLSPLRLAHFLALALMVVRLVPMDAAFLRASWARPIVLCGQNSLEVFCAGVFLSLTAHFVLREISDKLAAQVVVSFLGIGLMVMLALALDWYRAIERRPSTAEPEPDGGGIVS